MLYLNKEPVVPTIFPDGTSQVWNIDFIKRNNMSLDYCAGGDAPFAADILWIFEDEVEVIHLCQLVKLLKAYRLRPSLYIPYLPYARQDKYPNNEATFAFHAFRDVLNDMHLEAVHILDPHCLAQMKGIYHARIHEPDIAIEETIRLKSVDKLIFPDNGAMVRYAALSSKYDSVFFNKKRDKSGEITELTLVGEGISPKDSCLVVDDICDGGATFLKIAAHLRDVGRLGLYVTHGLFSKGREDLDNAFDYVAVYNYSFFYNLGCGYYNIGDLRNLRRTI